MKKIYLGIFFTIFLVASTVVPLYAEIYRYIDKNGVPHFTNTPTSPLYRIYLRETPKHLVKHYSADRYNHIITEASLRHGIDIPLLKFG